MWGDWQQHSKPFHLLLHLQWGRVKFLPTVTRISCCCLLRSTPWLSIPHWGPQNWPAYMTPSHLSSTPRTLKLCSLPSLSPIGMGREASLKSLGQPHRAGWDLPSTPSMHTAQSPLTRPYRDGQGDKSKVIRSTSAGGLCTTPSVGNAAFMTQSLYR
jgi:hypothetical protein